MKKPQTYEEVREFISKTLDEVFKTNTIGRNLGEARFVFKHSLRLQGLFLEDNNEIKDSQGNVKAWLGEVCWKDDNVLEAKVKLNTSIEFVPITIDIKSLT